MRRLTPLILLLSLSGCTGFGEFLDHAFSVPGENPNIPQTDSENFRRAIGQSREVRPLEVEPGNVWPRFDTRDPTLADVQNNPTREDQRGFSPTVVPGAQPGLPAGRQPRPTRGSSTPPGNIQPGPGGIPSPNHLPPAPPTSNAPRPPGGVVNTPQGPAVDAGGTNSYRQLNTPAGPGAIIVPNGNGTSTIINPNGSVQTVPTPR